MDGFVIRDTDFRSRVRDSFARQPLMETLGVRIENVEPGRVELVMEHDTRLTQQNGYIHAGALASILDSACGYSALTLTEPGADMLSVEFKVNLMAPAKGERFVAIGRVLRAGRSLSVTAGELVAYDGGRAACVCAMQATMMTMR